MSRHNLKLIDHGPGGAELEQLLPQIQIENFPHFVPIHPAMTLSSAPHLGQRHLVDNLELEVGDGHPPHDGGVGVVLDQGPEEVPQHQGASVGEPQVGVPGDQVIWKRPDGGDHLK